MAGVWPVFNDSLVTWAAVARPAAGVVVRRVMASEIEGGCTYDLRWRRITGL